MPLSNPDLAPLSAATVMRQASNLPYIVAVVVMMTLGVVAVVMITVLRPDQDNAAVITSIIGFLAPTTLSLLAFMKAQETHLSVNSRLDDFMETAKLAAHAQGLYEGKALGRQAADARTDQLRLENGHTTETMTP